MSVDAAVPPAPLRWGIVGLGPHATSFAESLARHSAGRVVAACGPAPSAAAFVAAHGGEVADDFEALLRVPGVEAAFVAHPRGEGREVIDRCLREGVPVLAAAPMTASARDTEWLVGLSGMTAAPLLEGWMYRTHPQWARLLELIADGSLGRVTRIAARAGAPNAPNAADAPETGAIDAHGGEPVSAALAIASAALGTAVSDLAPSIGGGGSRTPAGADADALAAIEFGGAITATIAVSITRDLGTQVRVLGDQASATLQTPFEPDNRRAVLRLENAAGEVHEEVLTADTDGDAAGAMAMAAIVRGGLNAPVPHPLVDHAESIATASLLEAWRVLVPAAVTG